MSGKACKDALVTGVVPGSVADEAGITAGDRLLSVNGQSMEDLIDYKYLISDEELILLVQKPNGDQWEIEIEKDYDEDLGLEFATATFDAMRRCANKCVFCFIDQNPPGLRESLYVYDDDYRLSFLYGQFVTLTNLRKRDWDRIARLHLSPLYVSIHTMDPELRVKMLNSPRARDIREQLNFFQRHDITIHAQIVLCPGLNDGEQLAYTVRELAKFYPTVMSVAVVPAGVTQFREHLPELRHLDTVGAKRLASWIADNQATFLQTLGTRFVWLADEVYITHDIPLPDVDIYENHPQLENGVGITKLFIQQFADALEQTTKKPRSSQHTSIITGILGAKVLQPMVATLSSLGVNTRIIPIRNQFFGDTITASGLVTGGDIARQLVGVSLGDEVVIPDVMLRWQDTPLFLDDMSLAQLEKTLGVPIKVLSGAQELVTHFVV